MNILKKINLVATLAAAMTASPLALAIGCTGSVSGVSSGSSGVLVAQSIGTLNWPYLCSVTTPGYNGVSPEACRFYAGQLMTAQVTGKTVTIYIGGSSCTNTAWSDLPGFYFMTLN